MTQYHAHDACCSQHAHSKNAQQCCDQQSAPLHSNTTDATVNEVTSHCCGSSTQTDCSASEDDGESDPSQLSWIVKGMDCGSCANKIQTALEKQQQINRVQVSFATQKLTVVLHPEATNRKLQSENIAQVVSQLGFELTPINTSDSTTSNKSSVYNHLKEYTSIGLVTGLMSLALVIERWSPLLSELAFIGAMLFGLWPIAIKAWRLAKSGTPFSIETLMSVAAVGALYLGETVEAGMVLVLFLIGEKLEGYAAHKARSGVQSLMALVPDKALVLKNGQRTEMDINALKPGMLVEVAPGQRLPADGNLKSDWVNVDQSALTGESVPVEKLSGEALMAGSIVTDKVAVFEVTSKAGQNSVDKILQLIEEAESHKAPVERFLDKFSRWYTPLMMVIAGLVVVIPPLMFAQSWQEWLYKGLALLLIACPCALVISTPAAITSGLARATRMGVLIKGGAALEKLATVDTLAMDKTGTLTKGQPEVTDAVGFDIDQNLLLERCAALEEGSTHPLAKALVSYCKEKGVVVAAADNRRILVGEGVQGDINQQRFQLVSYKVASTLCAFTERQNEVLEGLLSQGKTLAVLLFGDQAQGVIAWQDSLREDARSSLAKLSRHGIESIMLTGDNKVSAEGIASKLNIRAQSELLPDDKVKWVQEFSKTHSVAMVGDGINDAPALKSAQVGIAMGSGTNVALDTADAALTTDRLQSLPEMFWLANKTMSIIRQNITIALGLKAVFLITSILGYTGLWVAVLADSGATALVTLNALRLIKTKYPELG